MESKLITQLEKVLPKGISMPNELKLLYKWIEENGFYIDNKNGKRIGFLNPTNQFQGTFIQFECSEIDDWYWFDQDKDPDLKSRFCCFAVSGDGSMCGLWKATNNEVKVVHIGSGSGSTLLCTLAYNMLDFIRLLAIGYNEICWEEKFKFPPEYENPDYNENKKFKDWVIQTFSTEIPNNGLEIVKYPAKMEDEDSNDDFFNWCKGKFSFLE